MSRLVVVLPLAPLRVGERFAVRDWPLHITALPPFVTEATPAEIMAAIAGATATQTALTVRAGADELFGRRHDIPVTVMVEEPALISLHGTLVDAVRPFAATPEEPAFSGPGFRAHVTVKPHGRVNEGDEIELTQIALVDMTARSATHARAVLGTLPLPSPSNTAAASFH